MTTQKAIDILLILQDKYGSPDIEPSEAVDLLNMAMYEWLNLLLPDSQGGLVNVEYDSNTLELVKPLLWNFSVSYSSLSSGYFTTATLNTALQSASSDAAAAVFRTLDIAYVDGNSDEWQVRFLKNNNRTRFQRNFFKKPAIPKRLYWQPFGNGVRLQPTTGYTAGNFSFSVIKTPKILALSGPTVNPELDDYSMYSVIAKALRLAGVATRDEEILTDIRNSAIQIAQ